MSRSNFPRDDADALDASPSRNRNGAAGTHAFPTPIWQSGPGLHRGRRRKTDRRMALILKIHRRYLAIELTSAARNDPIKVALDRRLLALIDVPAISCLHQSC